MSTRPTSTNTDPLADLALASAEAAARFTLIYRTMLDESSRIKDPQFRAIEVADLERLHRLYDEHFFGGLLTRLIERAASPPVRFRLSNRMTRAAGKTIQQRIRERSGWRVVETSEYEIVISTYLLFQSFRGDPGLDASDRAVRVAGVVCTDRLTALLRIFEHELLHLAEFLVHGRSSCSAEPYRQLSRRLFGHEASVHTLVTPVERAIIVHKFGRGDRVAFRHAGVDRTGVVNRITKRATVLVADPAGRLHSDGVRYVSYLVPLGRLWKI